MKVLVLGNSDTAGLFSAGERWPSVMAAGLRVRSGDDVTLFERGFWALDATAPAKAVERAQECDADVVVLPLGSFAFTVGFVWVRVRRLFGERAGRRFRAAERGFDDRTRQRGGVRTWTNGIARRAARRLIGVEALHTARETAEAYVAVLRALSRLEAVDVMLVEYPAERGPGVVGGDIANRRREFMAAVRTAADAHRYPLLPCADTLGEGNEFVTPDGYHLSSAGHARLGTAVAEAIHARATTDTVPARARDRAADTGALPA
ncbi:MAG: SGNH/GDSL hydrolase family protein [Dehalococcoidia bacterium]|nr:SGNH/GDSL hydrolase family protein [Dehalococcoidia bacterium]